MLSRAIRDLFLSILIQNEILKYIVYQILGGGGGWQACFTPSKSATGTLYLSVICTTF